MTGTPSFSNLKVHNEALWEQVQTPDKGTGQVQTPDKGTPSFSNLKVHNEALWEQVQTPDKGTEQTQHTWPSQSHLPVSWGVPGVSGNRGAGPGS